MRLNFSRQIGHSEGFAFEHIDGKNPVFVRKTYLLMIHVDSKLYKFWRALKK